MAADLPPLPSRAVPSAWIAVLVGLALVAVFVAMRSSQKAARSTDIQEPSQALRDLREDYAELISAVRDVVARGESACRRGKNMGTRAGGFGDDAFEISRAASSVELRIKEVRGAVIESLGPYDGLDEVALAQSMVRVSKAKRDLDRAVAALEAAIR